jgi:MFS family permease
MVIPLDTAEVADRGTYVDEYRLRAAFLVSSTGDWIYRFALPLIVLELTHSALSTAFTYVIESIPFILIGLVAGNVADRSNRRRLLILCDGCSAVIVGIIALLLATGNPPVFILYAAALALASVRPFYFPTFQGFLVERVDGARRVKTNAWVQGMDSAFNLLGPVVGVALVVTIGAEVAAAINALSFAASALLVASTVKRADLTYLINGVWGNVRSDFVAGLKVIRETGPLWWGTVLMAGTNLALMAAQANLAFLIVGRNESSGTWLGVVVSAQGAGALVGASLAPSLTRRYTVSRLLCMGMGLLAVGLFIPAVQAGVIIVVVAWLVVGFGTSLIVVPWFTYRQEIVSPHLIGRVTSVSRSISFICSPIGAVAGSWVLVTAGRQALFILCGVVQAAVAIATLVTPLGRPPQSASRTAA